VHNGHVTIIISFGVVMNSAGCVLHRQRFGGDRRVFTGRMEHGRSLPEALEDSVVELDGAFNYLVASPARSGGRSRSLRLQPMVLLAETEDWVAVATEEIALRRALPGDYGTIEPPPASALFLSEQLGPTTCIRRASRKRQPLTARTWLFARSTRRSGRPIGKGVRVIRVLHPSARHNLGVGLPEGVELRVEGVRVLRRGAQ